MIENVTLANLENRKFLIVFIARDWSLPRSPLPHHNYHASFALNINSLRHVTPPPSSVVSRHVPSTLEVAFYTYLTPFSRAYGTWRARYRAAREQFYSLGNIR